MNLMVILLIIGFIFGYLIRRGPTDEKIFSGFIFALVFALLPLVIRLLVILLLFLLFILALAIVFSRRWPR
ncbi:MAG: hypothetical protein F7C35_08745 [Desulfurococcales archaeon]|nr:hypothetical protein [Desulfurococcales archaeon]